MKPTDNITNATDDPSVARQELDAFAGDEEEIEEPSQNPISEELMVLYTL